MLFPALCSGVAAGFVFFITQNTPLEFLTVLFLLFLGLSTGAKAAGIACAVACAVTALFTGLVSAASFTLGLALPAYYFSQRALLWRGQKNHRQWYPVLLILTELTAMVAVYFLFNALMAVEHGGLKALVPKGIGDGLMNTDRDVAGPAQLFTGDWNFTVLAAIGWGWVIMLYAFAVLSNSVLARKNMALRPTLALQAQGLPGWLLLLLAASALLALLGEGAGRFTGESLFLLLLLPYLLCGLAYVHAQSVVRHIPLRKLWIACFYFVILRFFWLLLAVIAVGFYLQLTEMLDRRKKIG